MVVMDQTPDALEAAVYDVQGAHSVSPFEAFAFSRRMQLFDPSRSFVPKRMGFGRLIATKASPIDTRSL